jgi:hypothetical protein
MAASAVDVDFGVVYVDQPPNASSPLFHAFAPLIITSVACESNYFSVDWQGEWVRSISVKESVSRYYEPTGAGFHQSSLDITCNAQEVPFISLAGSGMMA